LGLARPLSWRTKAYSLGSVDGTQNPALNTAVGKGATRATEQQIAIRSSATIRRYGSFVEILAHAERNLRGA
jgi:hypothetical protein